MRTTLQILCDSNMPYGQEAFTTLGSAIAKGGRQIKSADLADIEILATRSNTRVNADLLRDSPVRFYGSGVIGTDHIDIPYLESRGIVWCNAPGCNAESVANYITAALLWLGGKNHFRVEGKTLGVIGVGNVGRRICRHARALGMQVLANDPPRQRDAADHEARGFVSLDTLLRESDIVTCHVPLTRHGPDSTWHLLDADKLKMLKPGAVLINAARGAVVATEALLRAMDENIAHAVVDCWEGEPDYSLEVARRADLTTPHIAGHSFEGKVNGTAMVYRQACAFLDRPPTYPFDLPPPPLPAWSADAADGEDEVFLRKAVLAVYDIEADSQRLKNACALDADTNTRISAFDGLRSQYPIRREFSATSINLKNASPRLLAKVRGLGFAGDL